MRFNLFSKVGRREMYASSFTVDCVLVFRVVVVNDCKAGTAGILATVSIP